MATRHVMRTPQVEVNSVDLSNRVRSLELVESAADITSFLSGDTYTVYSEGGAKTARVSIEFAQDYDTGSVYQTLRPLLGQLVACKFKPKSGTAAADNPEFEVDCYINDLPSIMGNVGELATFTITWPISGEPTVNTS